MAELLSRRATLILLLWGALLHCSGAAADSVCGPTVILSTADADKVRRDCTTINGNLLINQTTEEINLDGLQTVNGSLSVWGCARDDTECPEQPEPFTISSSTLSAVHGYLGVDRVAGLSNLTLPNLEVVDGVFDLSRPLDSTYVDITNLHTVAGFFIFATPDLKTLRHNGLREITYNAGWGRRSIYVTQADVDSLDSLFKSPVIGNIYQAGFDLVPNVQELNFGLESVRQVTFTGNGNLTVTLGGPETTTMELGSLGL
ncbi:hypothetical protein AJ80_00935 [Polytolypa hystricis UAMH7299]|uniref:Receptor L-domain domain-containing protein n=1 Tax=Polytolypa hystricis (strain UAMH7299) TaxID=1447883 RepID=A0A2B7Z0K2_POLH7|nr:hypothetical protein AJ80_00935 [Polytolypa hystricis UAMH7299]